MGDVVGTEMDALLTLVGSFRDRHNVIVDGAFSSKFIDVLDDAERSHVQWARAKELLNSVEAAETRRCADAKSVGELQNAVDDLVAHFHTVIQSRSRLLEKLQKPDGENVQTLYVEQDSQEDILGLLKRCRSGNESTDCILDNLRWICEGNIRADDLKQSCSESVALISRMQRVLDELHAVRKDLGVN